MFLAVILAFPLGMSACTKPFFVQQNANRDIQDDQPWIGPDQQAEAFISNGASSLATTLFWLNWLNLEGQKVAKGHEVVERSRKYLEDQAVWKELRGKRIRLFRHNNPGPPRDMLIKPSRREYSVTPSMKPSEELPRRGFDEVLVIVSLDPIVVVQGPGKIQWTSSPGSADWSPTVGWEGEGKAPVHFLLPHGFAYGTEVPYSEDPQWFSPDLGIGPRSAEWVDEDTRRIEVPWGALILERVGEIWRVEARGTNAQGN